MVFWRIKKDRSILTAVREHIIEKYYIDRMAEEFPGCITRKFEALTNDPDRITFLPNGRAVLVELKRPDKEPRSGQYRAIKRYNDLGIFTDWANSKPMVDALIEKIKKLE